MEGSIDGKEYFTICDKRKVQTDLPHDFINLEEGVKVRFIRCTITELPFNQIPSISAFRVFGLSDGEKPTEASDIKTAFNGKLDVDVSWDTDNDTVGHTVIWGHKPDKLYHSIMVYGKSQCHIAALNANQPCYLRIDSFNESGITHGKSQKICPQ